jgi:hypothetical protein
MPTGRGIFCLRLIQVVHGLFEKERRHLVRGAVSNACDG